MNKSLPLMPKATAIWLIENTALTFEQIANFCGMHPLEVKGIADGEVLVGIQGVDPILNGNITAEDLIKAESDPQYHLKTLKVHVKHSQAKAKKKAKYTPIARRQDKPDAILWFIKNYPHISEAQIVKLIGTTKSTIQAIKNRSHWNIQSIKPKDPVFLGLCSQIELDNAIAKMASEPPEEIKNKMN